MNSQFITPPRHQSSRSSLQPFPQEPTSPIPEGSDLSIVAVALAETNKLLAKMSQRMDQVDGKISDIEGKITTSTPGTTPSRTSRKKEVPTEVRVSMCTKLTSKSFIYSASCIQRETRRVYAMLLEEDENFDGWSIGPR